MRAGDRGQLCVHRRIACGVRGLGCRHAYLSEGWSNFQALEMAFTKRLSSRWQVESGSAAAPCRFPHPASVRIGWPPIDRWDRRGLQPVQPCKLWLVHARGKQCELRQADPERRPRLPAADGAARIPNRLLTSGSFGRMLVQLNSESSRRAAFVFGGQQTDLKAFLRDTWYLVDRQPKLEE